MDLLTTNLEVTLVNRKFSVEFLIFPDASDNESLLGIDFLEKANHVFDFGCSMWYFSDDKCRKFQLSFEPVTRRPTYASLDLLREDEGCGLSDDKRSLLSQLLTTYEDVFAENGAPTDFAEHAINTGDHAPIAVPPYRLTPARRQTMQEEIDKMLAGDIIEDCESAWAAPALLVPKRNGGLRFCVDFRNLNILNRQHEERTNTTINNDFVENECTTPTINDTVPVVNVSDMQQQQQRSDDNITQILQANQTLLLNVLQVCTSSLENQAVLAEKVDALSDNLNKSGSRGKEIKVALKG
ncbi:uncharacterized protein LOC105391683 [Plutella xylostella]|uniref:uncharacterized protein LOC105391683 n=1 Tax=Plutella xylostella TaxID=51655 RepID=UPI00203315DB|nr:uncharacterized protein LOC105391683 [Plutella xylostella]